MTSTKNIFIAITVVFIAGAGIYLYESGKNSRDVTKIGFIGPLTGPGAPYGESAKNGLQIAIDEVNAKGGINGRKIQVIFEDGKCNGKDAATSAQKLTSIDKVKIILGGLCSGETIAAAPITESAKVILFSPGSSAPSITNAGDYVFRNHVSDDFGGQFLARTVFKNHKKIAIISENTDYAQGLRKSFITQFERLGGAVVFDESFDSQNKDFRSMIVKIKGKNPEAIFLNAQIALNAVAIARQARELGIKNQFYGAYLTGPEFLSGREAVEGALMMDDVGLTSEKGKSLLKTYKEKYGSEPPYPVYTAGEYDGLYLLKDAVEKVGENPDKIRDYLYALKNFNGALGNYRFDQNGDVVGINLAVKKVENGMFVEIQ